LLLSDSWGAASGEMGIEKRGLKARSIPSFETASVHPSLTRRIYTWIHEHRGRYAAYVVLIKQLYP
jgi:hypothetical protein